MHVEKIVYRARLHLFIFAQPLVILLIGWYYKSLDHAFHRYLGCLLLLLGAVSLLQRLLIVAGAEYCVTDHRVIFKTGVIGRRSRELLHMRIEALEVTQSVVGRILGYGTLHISTGGVINTYTYISDPGCFKTVINQCI